MTKFAIKVKNCEINPVHKPEAARSIQCPYLDRRTYYKSVTAISGLISLCKCSLSDEKAWLESEEDLFKTCYFSKGEQND